MKAVAELAMRLRDPMALRILAAVLEPDNVGLPRGTEIVSAASGKSLSYRIAASTPTGAVSTVLALLRDVGLYQEIWLLSRGGDGSVRKG